MLTINVLIKKSVAKLQKLTDAESLWHNIRKVEMFLQSLIRPVAPISHQTS